MKKNILLMVPGSLLIIAGVVFESIHEPDFLLVIALTVIILMFTWGLAGIIMGDYDR